MKQKTKAGTKEKAQVVIPEVLKPERAMVKHGQQKLPVQEMTPDARVNVIRSHLDKMENVQTIFAGGAVIIGMELIALKSQVNHGEFETIFKERIERPRFTYRTARKYMLAADLARTSMLKSGNDVIASSWDVAPSAMSIQKRRSLTEALGGLLNGKTLSDLLMGDRPTGGGGNGPAPRNGAKAEMQAVVETYKALRTQLARQILSHKHWRMLPADELASLRHALETALEELPK